jgi:hypothetical protein
VRPPLLALTGDQLSVVLCAAKPLHPTQRGAFLRRVAEQLCGRSINNAVVCSAAAAAQAELRGSTS